VFLEVLEQFPVFLVLSHQKEFVVGLKREFELGNEWFVSQFDQDSLFAYGILYLTFEGQLVFDQDLHSLDFTVQLTLDEIHLAK